MVRPLLCLALAAAGSLAAQDPPARAGRISYISGAVSFEPTGINQWVSAVVNRPLTIGDQIYADNGAKAEIHVPGTAFRLGSHTAFQFTNLDDRTVQVKLSEGTLDLRVRRLEGNLEIDTPNLAFTVSRPGEYRLDTNPDNSQTYVTVRDGEGQVTGTGGSFAIHAGQQATIVGQGQAAQYKVYAAPANDAFDQWVVARSQTEDRYAQARYVSSDVVGYEDLEQYGSWRQSPDYGEVWVPRGVAASWAPYQDGQWVWEDPWGWTWVDYEPWGFAPFHYGRWAFIDGYWGWCPGPVAVTPIFAPALVAWVGFGGGFGISLGFGAGGGFGWFPLGPRDVYIPAYNASAAYVTRINVTNTRLANVTNVTNVYSSYRRTGVVPVNTYMNHAVPGATVAVSRNVLANGQGVRQAIVRVPPNRLGAMQSAGAAPRVAPQAASVLGRTGRAVAPAAAVLARPVIARATPPRLPAPFAQRQALLARDPGRPLPIHQQPLAAAPAAKVIAHGHPVTPQTGNPSAPAVARTAVPARPYQPPAAQRSAQPAPARPNAAAAAPKQAARSVRPYEPPSVQQRAAQPAKPPAPAQHASRPAVPAQHSASAHPPAPPAHHNVQTHPSASPPQHNVQTHPAAPPPHHTAAARPPAPPPQHHSAPPHPAAPPPQHSAQARPPAPPPHAAPQPERGPEHHN